MMLLMLIVVRRISILLLSSDEAEMMRGEGEGAEELYGHVTTESRLSGNQGRALHPVIYEDESSLEWRKCKSGLKHTLPQQQGEAREESNGRL
jgi:hypothetical protein